MIEPQKPLSPLEWRLLDILEAGPLTRDQIVKKTGIPRTTIYEALDKLMTRDVVKKYPLYLSEPGRGRPKVLFQLTRREEPYQVS